MECLAHALAEYLEPPFNACSTAIEYATLLFSNPENSIHYRAAVFFLGWTIEKLDLEKFKFFDFDDTEINLSLLHENSDAVKFFENAGKLHKSLIARRIESHTAWHQVSLCLGLPRHVSWLICGFACQDLHEQISSVWHEFDWPTK